MDFGHNHYRCGPLRVGMYGPLYVYTLHDEVVSLLISGCEIIVYSFSPMAVIMRSLLRQIY